MEWPVLQAKLGISPELGSKIEAILIELQHNFFYLCANQDIAQGELIIDRLAQFIANENPDPHSISSFLLGSLETEQVGGKSKLKWLQEMELKAERSIIAELPYQLREQFFRLAPSSLLDIAVSENPFSVHLEEKVHSTPPPGFVCRSPYEYAHVQANGDVYPCCPSKFGKIIGNLTMQTIDEIWMSEEAQSVRDSIEQGDYRYCNAEACEYLRRANADQVKLSPNALVEWSKNKGLLEYGRSPKIINLGSDRTCNLACGYCRKSLFKLTEAERERISLIDLNTFRGLSDNTERIVLLGEGDPFASPIYLQKMRTYNWAQHPKLKIKIQTNGLLLTPIMWESIASCHSVIDWISVSVDAASAETYALNRGGDFNKLLRNLEFIAKLRAEQQIDKFWINFLVQQNNYREIPAFAQLGKRLGCDLIEFQRIENWGTYSEEEYRVRAIHEAWHPENTALMEILKDPILKSPEIWLLKVSAKLNESTRMSIISWDE